MNDTFLRKAWTDSVWSKVIATGITTVLAGLLGALAAWWRTLESLRGSIFRLIDRPVTLPAWSLLTLGCLTALVLWQTRRHRLTADTADALQPNAVPILEARVAAHRRHRHKEARRA